MQNTTPPLFLALRMQSWDLLETFAKKFKEKYTYNTHLCIKKVHGSQFGEEEDYKYTENLQRATYGGMSELAQSFPLYFNNNVNITRTFYVSIFFCTLQSLLEVSSFSQYSSLL